MSNRMFSRDEVDALIAAERERLRRRTADIHDQMNGAARAARVAGNNGLASILDAWATRITEVTDG